MQEILKKIELATDNNVVTKSDKDNNAKDTDLSPEEAQELKAERDYWEREAKNMKEVLREEITGIILSNPDEFKNGLKEVSGIARD